MGPAFVGMTAFLLGRRARLRLAPLQILAERGGEPLFPFLVSLGHGPP